MKQALQNKTKKDSKSTRWHGIVWIVKLTLSNKGREANTSRPLHATQSKSARLAISIRTLYQFVYSVGVVDLQIEINWRNPLQFWGYIKQRCLHWFVRFLMFCGKNSLVLKMNALIVLGLAAIAGEFLLYTHFSLFLLLSYQCFSLLHYFDKNVN